MTQDELLVLKGAKEALMESLAIISQLINRAEQGDVIIIGDNDEREL